MSQTAEYRKNWGLRQQGKPCRRCGSTRRQPNGNCRDCDATRQQKLLKDNPVLGKKKHLPRTYGITGEEKERMYESQAGLCKFCKEPLPGVWERGCHVEHDHTTGAVRGLVHHKCNQVIAVLENEKYIALALEYFR